MKAATGRIWEAASKVSTRPVLTHVAFDAKKATLTATDSYMAVRVPCEVEEGDESGLIPAAALKEAGDRSLRIADGNATLTLPDGERSWKLLADGTFPDVDKILADYAKDTPAIRFGLNARLLSNLSAAMWGNEKDMPVTLSPSSPIKAIVVKGRGDTIGVLMPIRIPGTNDSALPPLNLENDAAIIAAARAACQALDGRRGKKRAAQVFRETLRVFQEEHTC